MSQIVNDVANDPTVSGFGAHTANEVEFSFEPPTLIAMFANIDYVEEKMWKLLFETYCFEELLAGNLTGRGFNFNVHDDSNIYRTNNKQE